MLSKYQLVFPEFNFVEKRSLIQKGKEQVFPVYTLVWKDNEVKGLPDKYESMLSAAEFALHRERQDRIIQLANDANKEFMTNYPVISDMLVSFACLKQIAVLLGQSNQIINGDTSNLIPHLVIRKFWVEQHHRFCANNELVEDLEYSIRNLRTFLGGWDGNNEEDFLDKIMTYGLKELNALTDLQGKIRAHSKYYDIGEYGVI